jgi:hypothetical protein
MPAAIAGDGNQGGLNAILAKLRQAGFGDQSNPGAGASRSGGSRQSGRQAPAYGLRSKGDGSGRHRQIAWNRQTDVYRTEMPARYADFLCPDVTGQRGERYAICRSGFS